eukprot:COSAG03_NODE_22345_length_292_cov_0.792746_1_plen_35_part_10
MERTSDRFIVYLTYLLSLVSIFFIIKISLHYKDLH